MPSAISIIAYKIEKEWFFPSLNINDQTNMSEMTQIIDTMT